MKFFSFKKTSFIVIVTLLFTAFIQAGTVSADTGLNLALGKTAVASSVQGWGYEASSAFDGNMSTRWSSQFSDGQWIYVDLGSRYNLSSVVLKWESAYATRYVISTSNDAVNWTAVYTEGGAGGTNNGGNQTLTLTNAQGRYVRLYCINRATAYGFSLYEVEVYGTSANLALGKAATASSVENTGLEASRAFDGNMSTRWSSQFSDGQWIYIDLGQRYDLSTVELKWENAYAIRYVVSTSDDAVNWTAVYTEGGAGGTNSGGNQTLNLTNAQGRYLRLYCINRATPYGFSLYEIEAYGTPAQ